MDHERQICTLQIGDARISKVAIAEDGAIAGLVVGGQTGILPFDVDPEWIRGIKRTDRLVGRRWITRQTGRPPRGRASAAARVPVSYP
jgi:protein gp37